MKTFRKASQAIEYIKRITEINQTNNGMNKIKLQVKKLDVFNHKSFPSEKVESKTNAPKEAEVGKAGEVEEVDINFGEFVPNDDINDDWLRRLIMLRSIHRMLKVLLLRHVFTSSHP